MVATAFALCLYLSQATYSLKLFNLPQAYFSREPSAGLLYKKVEQEDLPIYRDLPPIKRSTPEDLSVALEATRNLEFSRPPLDAMAFYEGLRKAAEETRAVVANIAPATPFIPAVQVNKSTDSTDVEDNKAEVKSEFSKEEPEAKASEVDVSVQAPFTNVQVSKGAAAEYRRVDLSGPSSPEVKVRVETPFTNVKVRKQSGEASSDGALPGVGVNVEAPFVKVNVDTPGSVSRRSFLSDFLNVGRQRKTSVGEFPAMFGNGKPLDLDINIPGIFNLKLLRDENGRGRLGIGVLPIISSLVNKNKPLESYPGPPPA